MRLQERGVRFAPVLQEPEADDSFREERSSDVRRLIAALERDRASERLAGTAVVKRICARSGHGLVETDARCTAHRVEPSAAVDVRRHRREERPVRSDRDASLLWAHSKVTLTEILLGFGLTVVTAIPLGLVIALSPLAKQLVYPPLMLMQLVPKIAVAPLFLVWLGFGMESKVLLTVLLTFFPLLLASISGFQILDDRLLYLTQSMGATRWQTFRYLRFPAALPVIFSGIKTSATIAATAAIVAEFVGANKGLGYVLLRGTSTMDIELVFAVLVVLTVVGIAVNYAVEFCEWAMTPWQRAKNS